MTLNPQISQFREKYLRKENQIVYTRLTADLDTAVSLLLKLTNAKPDSFVLESVTGGEIRGRYSFVGMRPDLIWECKNKIATINRFPNLDSEQDLEFSTDPLASLRTLLGEMTMDIPDGLPSGSAGLFGYLGYDIIRLVENLPSELPDPLNLPDSILMRPSVVVVLDGVKGEVIIISPAWYSEDESFETIYEISQKLVTETLNLLEADTLTQQRSLLPPEKAPVAISNFTHSEYLSIIRRVKDYIIAGDVFQVVPSQRWKQSFTLPPFSLYRALRRTNPSPFMFYFNMGKFQIVGASPEILVRVFGRKITIRPIAGTRARGKTEEEDLLLEKDLLSDPKELSEHLMLLDLGRNDVGRVSKIGSVNPTEKFIIEKYSHVMHIVSNVTGELKPGEDSLSALLSGLPAGTVSGAPKIRAMEIIDELEPEKRGVYGGGCGYFSANGDMDMCISLRTGVIKNKKLYIQAGGGVVFDSDPEAEFTETVNKSKALRVAAEQASMFTSIYDLS
jgi:anthranilate synthase component 1